MLQELWDIFIAMARVGVLGYGGGPSSVPLIQVEAVNNYNWMTTEEFADALAMGYALPGPIATKMAGVVGFKVAGVPGAMAGVMGMVLPSLIAVIILYKLFTHFKHSDIIDGMTRGVRPVIVVLLALMVWETMTKAVDTTSPLITGGIALVSLAALQYLHINPAWVVFGSLVFGAIALR